MTASGYQPKCHPPQTLSGLIVACSRMIDIGNAVLKIRRPESGSGEERGIERN